MKTVWITKDPLHLAAFLEAIPKHPCCGGRVFFSGVVRNENEARKVKSIFYECYESMAQKELEAIVAEAKDRFDVHALHVAHRIGLLAVGETSLMVAAYAPHRKATFEAVQYCIHTIKERVPIWKKENYEEG